MKQSIRAAARLLYASLSVLLLLCVVLQFYWAGLAVFGNASHWSTHVQFVHLFGFNLPVVMLLAAFAAAHRRWAYWHLLLLMLSTFLMYLSANLPLGSLRALHPLVGTLLLAAAISNCYRSIHACRKRTISA